MNRDQTYVNQILDAINKIQDYTVEGRDVFYETIIIQDAVMRNIEIIGEIAKRISDDFKEKYDTVPWRKMAGIRDVLIHDYDSIDMSIVWNVISMELPKIRRILSKIV
ncbi:MAG: DUF86 domain-containing protein [Methanosarcinales archaeon]|nr:DUF86 domain-containing protein [Methanosarcinales archaeon]